MKMLHKKLLRDLWRLRYQALTIALLVGCGIASFVSSITAATSMKAARDAFYSSARFADLFVSLNRVPRTMRERLAALPGVAVVEGRVADDFRLELAATTEPLSGHFVSLAGSPNTRLNALEITAGREPEAGSDEEVVVSTLFAQAWSLVPGSTMTAVINGRRTTLRIVGLGDSPEFVWPPPRAGMPDTRHLAVLWMDETALAKAAGLEGEFNDFVFQLAVGAKDKDLIDRIDTLLEPYGGLGTVARKDQNSGNIVEQKITQLAKMAIFLPAIFLGVAAFLLNVLISRIVGTQREQIATLKALGYRTRELLVHYLELALAMCGLGVILGGMLGIAGAKALLVMFAQFLHFPSVHMLFDVTSLGTGTVAALAAAVGGCVFAVRKAVAIPPAEAMRPEPPPSFHATWLDRVYNLIAPAMRMVLRDVQGRPLRLVLSAASIALAVSIVVSSGAMTASIAETLRLHFEVAHKEDITVTFDKPRPWRAISDLAHFPGVRAAEGERDVPVRLVAGSRFRTTAIIGLDPESDLHTLLDIHLQPLKLAAGLSLSRPLADELSVVPGDIVEVQSLEAGQKRARVPVAQIIDDFVGMSGYMQATELARLLEEGRSANVALLSVDRKDTDEEMNRLNALPAAASVSRPAIDRGLLTADVSDVYTVMQIILAMFALAIAVGVVYNNARIALEMRSRDLATLRILGFTRTELAAVLISEQAIQVILGVLPGVWLGRFFGAAIVGTIDRERMRVPFSPSPSAEVAGVCLVLFAALVSTLIVRAASDKLDLVAVLKARD